jgi:toxin ParE1/3/4
MSEARYRVLFADDVYQNLLEIHNYIAKRSPEQAAETIRMLLDAVASLEESPGRFAEVEYEDFAYPVRRLPVRPYRILYRIDEERMAVRIIRVEHGSRGTR